MNNYGNLNANRNGRKGLPAVMIVLFLLLALGGVGTAVVGMFSSETHTACVIEDKDRTRNSEGNSDMRIYTENCGTFQVGDNLFLTGFNSADRYANIKVGKTYNIESYGFRVGFFSMFPKIKTVTEV